MSSSSPTRYLLTQAVGLVSVRSASAALLQHAGAAAPGSRLALAPAHLRRSALDAWTSGRARHPLEPQPRRPGPAPLLPQPTPSSFSKLGHELHFLAAPPSQQLLRVVGLDALQTWCVVAQPMAVGLALVHSRRLPMSCCAHAQAASVVPCSSRRQHRRPDSPPHASQCLPSTSRRLLLHPHVRDGRTHPGTSRCPPSQPRELWEIKRRSVSVARQVLAEGSGPETVTILATFESDFDVVR